MPPEKSQEENKVSQPGNTVIRDYPTMLEELTCMFDVFIDERVILRYHLENYDGSGYPEGLKGNQIPIGARLFTLVDEFVAMTSKPGDKKVFAPDRVIDEIVKEAGHQFDPLLVNHLLDLIEEKKLLPLPGIGPGGERGVSDD